MIPVTTRIYIMKNCDVFREMKVVPGDDDVAWPKHVDSVIKHNVFRLMLCFIYGNAFVCSV
jgi:hypothetical protein